MKYIGQLGIILGLSLAGEVCHALLPLPIPASIYGMVLMLLGLWSGCIKLKNVKDTGNFLVSILPLLFVVPAVGLMGCWELVRDYLWQILVILVLTTVVTFFVAGTVTRMAGKRRKKDD